MSLLIGERYPGMFKPGDGVTIGVVLVGRVSPALLIAFSNRRACLRRRRAAQDPARSVRRQRGTKINLSISRDERPVS
jgi:hypothetical protein